MLSATAHIKEKNFYQELKEALDFANKEKVKEIFKDILKQTELKTKRKKVLIHYHCFSGVYKGQR